MAIFKERQHEREIRVKAAKWFTEKTGLCVKVHRAYITAIKKVMLAGGTPTLSKHLLKKMKEVKDESSKQA